MNPLLAKKTPEESKVTKMMVGNGWNLVGGNDVWLIFKKKGVPGEVTVTRGTKEWIYDLPGSDMFESEAEGKGLESLLQALPTFKAKARAMHANSATTAVNNAGKGGSPNIPELCDPTKAPIVATDPHGHAQVDDAPKVLAYIAQRGAALPAEVAKEFGWKHEQAYSMLQYLKSEGKLGLKQMRYYVKQASKFRFKSRVLYRHSAPINVFQLENKTLKEGGPQGDDISRKSNGDYPRMRRTR